MLVCHLLQLRASADDVPPAAEAQCRLIHSLPQPRTSHAAPSRLLPVAGDQTYINGSSEGWQLANCLWGILTVSGSRRNQRGIAPQPAVRLSCFCCSSGCCHTSTAATARLAPRMHSHNSSISCTPTHPMLMLPHPPLPHPQFILWLNTFCLNGVLCLMMGLLTIQVRSCRANQCLFMASSGTTVGR